MRVRHKVWQHRRQGAGDRLRRGDHNKRHLEPDARQRDHADHDANRTRRCANCQRILRANLEGIVEIAPAQPLGRVKHAHHDTCRDARERRHVRRTTTHQHVNQNKQRDQRRPTLTERLFKLRHLFFCQATQVLSLGLKVHLHKHAEKIQEGRKGGCQCNIFVRDVKKLNHQERSCAHDGRRNLPACARGGLNRRSEMSRVAYTNHCRDGQRPHCHGVSDRRARQHAEHRRAHDRNLGRPACITAGNGRGHIQKQLAKANSCREHTEQHKVKNIRRHNTYRYTVNALTREVHMVNNLRPRIASVL